MIMFMLSIGNILKFRNLERNETMTKQLIMAMMALAAATAAFAESAAFARMSMLLCFMWQ